MNSSHVTPWSTIVINIFWHELSISEVSSYLLSVLFVEGSLTIHLIIRPFTNIRISICKCLFANALNFVVFKISLILRPIFPDHCSFSMHAVFLEFPFVNSFGFCKKILSFSMKLAIYKIPLIDIAIKLKFSLSSLLALLEVSSVNNLVVLP